MNLLETTLWNSDRQSSEFNSRRVVNSIIDDLTQANVDLRNVTLAEMKEMISEACRRQKQRPRGMAVA